MSRNGQEQRDQRDNRLVAQPYGIRLIAAERRRQMEQEGWTPEHDDEHVHAEIVDAAVCYALAYTPVSPPGNGRWRWPWEQRWWKPKNRERNLVKAGALIAAELDRLGRQRAGRALANADAIREPGR